MEEIKKPATETNTETIVTQEVNRVTVEDLEAKNAALEAEKVKLEEEAANYKAAYFKEKGKSGDDDEDERMKRIAKAALAESRLAEITREQDAIIKKALKENKELRLANANKTDIPASTTTHSEGQAVRDTIVTPDQMAHFKSMGKSDKWIENYKKNLQRGGGR